MTNQILIINLFFILIITKFIEIDLENITKSSNIFYKIMY